MRPKLLSVVPVICLVTVTISSCNQRNTNTIILDELNSNLASNNTFLSVNNENIFAALQFKAADIRSKEKAEVWLPKAESIKKISANIQTYLDSIRHLIARSKEDDEPSIHDLFNENNLEHLHDRLVDYRNQILATHPKIQYALSEVVNRNLFGRDSLISANEYQQKYFNGINRQEAVSMLTLLQNKILRVEHTGLAFCNEQFTSHGDHFDFLEAFVGQNAQLLKAGNDLEITAGLGSFNRTKLPIITIGGDIAPLNERGFTVYKLKTSKKPGHYSIPVQIEFADQDGKKQERTFNVEYSVVETR